MSNSDTQTPTIPPVEQSKNVDKKEDEKKQVDYKEYVLKCRRSAYLFRLTVKEQYTRGEYGDVNKKIEEYSDKQAIAKAHQGKFDSLLIKTDGFRYEKYNDNLDRLVPSYEKMTRFEELFNLDCNDNLIYMGDEVDCNGKQEYECCHKRFRSVIVGSDLQAFLEFPNKFGFTLGTTPKQFHKIKKDLLVTGYRVN